MKEVVLTQEMKEKLAGHYLIDSGNFKMVRLGDIVELTPENFKAYLVDDKDVLQELTVHDFTWYNEDGSDKDFLYREHEDFEYLDRDYVPEEVKVLLDEVIEKRLKAAEETKK